MEAAARGDNNNNNSCEDVIITTTTTSVDWRGRPSNPIKHGGMKAAAFVLGLQGFEIMGIAAVGNNLITYVINEMHFSLSESANIVTNFIGTIFILSLLGGYLSDSYLASFWTILIFGFIELSGFILLSVQAHLPQLKPPKCNMLTDGDKCVEAKGFKALIFFVALYLVALGSGCVKPNMIAHGGDQFNQENPKQSKQLSRYFNAAYFAFSMGELIALTILVYVQTHSGMDVGFGVSAAAMALGLICLVCGTLFYRNKPPQGSIFTPIAQVMVAAFLNRKLVSPSDAHMLHKAHPTKALPNANPTINLLHTNRFRKFTGHESGITPLQRIGVGLFFATFSMVSAALMENKRRISAVELNETLSIFWITPQFLIFGISEMFTAVGLIEFFYKQSLKGSMQSFLTAITYCSYSFGFYLSSLLVSLVNKITSSHHGGGWLSDNNLNKDRLDLFYWLLAILSLLNFFNYLFWAKWYSKNGCSSSATTNQELNSKVVGEDGIV
uniref:Peptide/nitrate transporter n=1 Tax=Solanum tuberosum TaxID=4113 RepID=M1BUV7_SOLTU